MRQEQINELVDRFYVRLVKDPYYSNMFAERKVDLELLKERQRAFISRLANPEAVEDDHGAVHQVKERHHFGVNPEKAVVWMTLMKETMEEMNLKPEEKEPLLKKIQFLLDRMIDKG